MSERHGEPLAPDDDSGWRIYSRDDDGEPMRMKHEPSGVEVHRDWGGGMIMHWDAVRLRYVKLRSRRGADLCAEALGVASRHLRGLLARLEGEQRSPDSAPDNGARPDTGSGA